MYACLRGFLRSAPTSSVIIRDCIVHPRYPNTSLKRNNPFSYFIFIGLFVSNFSMAQSGKFGSPEFLNKAERLGVEFFIPIEREVKTKKLLKDDFEKYDLVLKSGNQLELRYILQPIDIQGFNLIPPHVELTRIMASLATNDEEEHILVRSFTPHEAQIYYGADWGLYADFIPKKTFSRFPKARIVSLYKEDKGLIMCIILYRSEDLEGFLGLPIKFKSSNEQSN